MAIPIIAKLGGGLVKKGLGALAGALGVGGKSVQKVIGDVMGVDMNDEKAMLTALEDPENIKALASIEIADINAVVAIEKLKTEQYVADVKGGSWLAKNIRPLSLASTIAIFGYCVATSKPEYIVDKAEQLAMYFGSIYIVVRSVLDKKSEASLVGKFKGLLGGK